MAELTPLPTAILRSICDLDPPPFRWYNYRQNDR
jgi:hypothetical protein